MRGNWTEKSPMRKHPALTPFEDMNWNQPGFHRRQKQFFIAMEKVLQQGTRKLDTSGFLLTRGDRGQLLIGPVYFDPKDHDGVYRRFCKRLPSPRQGEIYGSARLLKRFGLKEAKLLSEKKLIEMTLANCDYKHVVRESDGLRFDVAMLFPWPTKTKHYSCGLYLTHEGVAVLNPELPRSRINSPHVRYTACSIHPVAIEPLLKHRWALL